MVYIAIISCTPHSGACLMVHLNGLHRQNFWAMDERVRMITWGFFIHKTAPTRFQIPQRSPPYMWATQRGAHGSFHAYLILIEGELCLNSNSCALKAEFSFKWYFIGLFNHGNMTSFSSSCKSKLKGENIDGVYNYNWFCQHWFIDIILGIVDGFVI